MLLTGIKASTNALSNTETKPTASNLGLTQTRNGQNGNPIYFDPTTLIHSRVVHQQQLLHTFIRSMTASHQNELSPALGTYRRWLPHLIPLVGTHTLLDESMRACTLAHIGRLHNSSVFMHEAQIHYGRALRHLNDSLQDPSRSFASETLGATILLSIFEMFASSSNQSWIRHADGVGTLMKLRGPHRHRTGIDREMFLAYRRTLVAQAIQTDQKTFLNEHQWRLLSRDIHNDIRESGIFGAIEKSELFEVDQLLFLEIVAFCDNLYESNHVCESAETTGDDAGTIISKLTASTSSCRRTLKSLLRRLTSAIQGAGHEPLKHTTSDPVFPVQYEFVNMYVASLYVSLWTTIIRANRLVMRFEQSQQKLQQFHTEILQMATECCQCVAYMATSSFLGPFFMILALRTCLLVFDGQDEQKSWIIAKLTELGESKLAIAKDIPSQGDRQRP